MTLFIELNKVNRTISNGGNLYWKMIRADSTLKPTIKFTLNIIVGCYIYTSLAECLKVITTVKKDIIIIKYRKL